MFPPSVNLHLLQSERQLFLWGESAGRQSPCTLPPHPLTHFLRVSISHQSHCILPPPPSCSLLLMPSLWTPALPTLSQFPTSLPPIYKVKRLQQEYDV